MRVEADTMTANVPSPSLTYQAVYIYLNKEARP